MKTFSEELREAREAKGLTLEELAASTKISYKVLKAIETGDFDVLPQTYIKGFLRTYAREVGLDEFEVVRNYEEYIKSTVEIYTQSRRTEKTVSRKSPWYFWVSLVGIGMILFVGLHFLRGVHQKTIQTQSVVEENDSSRSTVEVQSHQLVPEDSDSIQPPVNVLPHEADTGQAVQGEKELEGELALSEDTQDIIGDSVDPQGLTLSAEAISDTWIRVLADGDVLYEGIMRVGASTVWKADRLFELKIGKADGLRLVLNGQPLGSLGAPEKVVSELILDTNGIVRKILR